MPRTQRTRSKSSQWTDGFARGAVNNVGFADLSSLYDVSGKSITDYRGSPTSDGLLDIQEYDKSKLTLVEGQGGAQSDPTWHQYENFPLGRYKSDFTTYVTGTFSGLPSEDVQHTEIRARTNPSRPDYAIGHYIQDLVELPRMIKDIGDQLKRGSRRASPDKTAANNYLAAKFGWLPLFDDMQKLFDVYKYIDRRNDELARLFSSSGLKRRVGLGEFTGTNTQTVFVESGPRGSLTARAEQVLLCKTWGTIRWKPTIPPSHYPNNSARLALAKKTVLGATASGAFASSWDLIPWTWLLGWCTNVRSYVLAHGNTVPAAPSGMSCLMRHTVGTREFKVTSISSGLKGGYGTIEYERKQRSVRAKPSLSAFLPYLDGGRLSVLGALAVQRFR